MDPLTSPLKDTALRDHPSTPTYAEEITQDSVHQELLEERKNAKLAALQVGQKPGHRPSSSDLILQQKRDMDSEKEKLPKDCIRTYRTVVTEEYPPCSRALDSLVSITLKDLLVGIRHEDNYIVLRTITDPVRKAGIKTVVEDHEGMAESLTLYNVNYGLDDHAFLPIESYLVIKAPFFTLGTHGCYSIRCDHPSDVVVLHDTHPLVTQFSWATQPQITGTVVTCEALKEQGNRLFNQENNHGACAKYTIALQQNELLRKENFHLWATLHLNRAVARLKILQYEGALRDCEEVLSCRPTNKKAMFLKARALYLLRQFHKSAEACKRALLEYSDLAEAKNLLEQCVQRLKEATRGVFDFPAMEAKARGKGDLRLDHADYIGPVEIRPCSDLSRTGKGLFAMRDIKQGELLICEKAFAAMGETSNKFHITYNTCRMEVYSGARARLPCEITRFIYDNPSTASSVMQLSSSSRRRRNPNIRYTPEGQPIINAFVVDSIVEENMLELGGGPMFFETPAKPKDADSFGGACGLWITMSYLNHCCLENVGRTFVGDFVIVRALRTIKKGQELLQSYAPTSKPLKERQEIFKQMNFTCKCALCTYEEIMLPVEIRGREVAVAAFKRFEAENSKRIANMSPELAPQVHRHIEAILHTYANPVFCFELLRPYSILCNLQYSAQQLKGCVNSLCKIMGYLAGIDPLADEDFEPMLWISEYIYHFFYLCIVLEALGDKRKYDICWRKSKMLLGIYSGVGYEAARIDEALQCFKRNMRIC